MTGQMLLFDFPDLDVLPIDDLFIHFRGKRCGTCASMDTTLPGCFPAELGRCIDPSGRSYYLNPENTKPNDWLEEGDPEKYPTGGSWAYVAKESCACDKHRPKGRAQS